EIDHRVEPGRHYWYRLLVTDRGVTRVLGSPIQVTTPAARFALGSTGPNPAHGSIDVEFQLPRPADIALDLFDPQGRRVATLDRGVQRRDVEVEQPERRR